MFRRLARHAMPAWVLALVLAVPLWACGSHWVFAKSRRARQAPTKITLTDRTVNLKGGINDALIKTAQERLLKLDDESHDPIWIRISSHGGSVEAGLIFMDTMRGVRSPIYCLVESSAYSMAGNIFVFCDKRYALPHATIMLHEASYGTAGEDPSIRSRLDFITRFLDTMHHQIAERLDMDYTEYRKKLRDGWWMLAHEAKKVGIVQEIVSEIARSPRVTTVTEIKTTRTLKTTTHSAPADAASSKIPKRR